LNKQRLEGRGACGNRAQGKTEPIAKLKSLNIHSFALIQMSNDTLIEADKKSVANQKMEEVSHKT